MVIQDEPLGLLLLRVKDDLSMTIMCYKALFENSVQYGLKKALEVYYNYKFYFVITMLITGCTDIIKNKWKIIKKMLHWYI